MSDLSTIIDKPIAILPEANGVPTIGNSGLTPEKALHLAVNETLKAFSVTPIAINQTIISDVIKNNNGHNVTLELVNQVLKQSSITHIGKASIGKILTDLKMPTGLSSYALNFKNGLNSLETVKDGYGIYQNNAPALMADTITATNVTASAKIASHPVQSGAFANYNKVQEPNKIVVRMAKSGQGSNAKSMRDAFIKRLDELKQGVDLLSIVTPNQVFNNMNLTAYNYRFESGGSVSMIVVEATFDEVREVKPEYTSQVVTNPNGTPAINNPQSVNAQSPQSGGYANAQPATPQEIQYSAGLG